MTDLPDHECAAGTTSQLFSWADFDFEPVVKAANVSLRSASTIRPSKSKPVDYMALGTAIDYRIRHYFGFDARRDLQRPYGWGIYPDSRDASRDTRRLFARLESEIQDLKPWRNRLSESEEEMLCRYCALLANYRGVRRDLGPSNIESFLALPPSHWIDDLKKLSRLFFDQDQYLVWNHGHAISNPWFGKNDESRGLPGDLIVDHCLIDIKSTVRRSIRPEYLNQLMTYVLLDYSDQYRLTAVGIYMARQGKLLTWPLTQFIQKATGNSQIDIAGLRDRFREKVASDKCQIERITPQETGPLAAAPLPPRQLEFREIPRRPKSTHRDSMISRKWDSFLRAIKHWVVIAGKARASTGVRTGIETTVKSPSLVSRRIHIVGDVSADTPTPPWSTEDSSSSQMFYTVEVSAELVERFGELFALRVKGTGMTDALIDDGDVVVMRAIAHANNGEMVLAWFKEEEAILRKFYSESDYVRLQPANSTMEPIYAPKENMEVRGKVVSVIRNLVSGDGRSAPEAGPTYCQPERIAQQAGSPLPKAVKEIDTNWIAVVKVLNGLNGTKYKLGALLSDCKPEAVSLAGANLVCRFANRANFQRMREEMTSQLSRSLVAEAVANTSL